MKSFILLLTAGIPLLLPSCADMAPQQRTALMGTALGAAAGGIIGHQKGHAAQGAVVGGIMGTLFGSAFGTPPSNAGGYSYGAPRSTSYARAGGSSRRSTAGVSPSPRYQDAGDRPPVPSRPGPQEAPSSNNLDAHSGGGGGDGAISY